MRGLGSSKYNTNKYTVVSIYILSKDGVILITRELYIVNNLLTKVFISVDIIKSKDIIIDIRRDLVIITSYNSLEVPVSIVIKGTRTDTIIINKSR